MSTKLRKKIQSCIIPVIKCSLLLTCAIFEVSASSSFNLSGLMAAAAPAVAPAVPAATPTAAPAAASPLSALMGPAAAPTATPSSILPTASITQSTSVLNATSTADQVSLLQDKIDGAQESLKAQQRQQLIDILIEKLTKKDSLETHLAHARHAYKKSRIEITAVKADISDVSQQLHALSINNESAPAVPSVVFSSVR
jgi:hypothetical protein